MRGDWRPLRQKGKIKGILKTDLHSNHVKSTEPAFKVIALYCIAHPYCARFVASLARAVSARTSRE